MATTKTIRGNFGAASEQEMNELLFKGQVYARKTPVLAVLLSKPLIIEQRDGSIVEARPGDYLIRNIEGDKRPWILPWDYFESNFEKYNSEQ